MSETLDAQTIGLLGRDKVIEQLHRAGLEVALPRRDRGIDVIAYADKASSFQALPIQVKASANFRWVVYQKYEPFAELVIDKPRPQILAALKPYEAPGERWLALVRRNILPSATLFGNQEGQTTWYLLPTARARRRTLRA